VCVQIHQAGHYVEACNVQGPARLGGRNVRLHGRDSAVRYRHVHTPVDSVAGIDDVTAAQD
jgi:hypothetical protein